MRVRWSPLGLGMLVLLACHKEPKPPPAPAAPPDCKVADRPVELASRDGLTIHGVVATCAGSAPGAVVVLVHQMCKDHREWSEPGHDWVSWLRAQGQGMTTLAIDLRGFGQSQTWPDGSKHDLCKDRGAAEQAGLHGELVDDVLAAVKYARASLGARRVAVVGSSIGANAALLAMGSDADIAAVVALSPALDYLTMRPETQVVAAGARPIQLLASQGDDPSFFAAMHFRRVNPAVKTKLWRGHAHGNAMLAAHPEALAELTAWLAAALSGS
jgi:alpha-beta hydrolase superfamily lysophospholipase